MWHRLALKIGATVEELQDRMTSAEFTRWKAYYAIEPFGYELEIFQSGLVASTVCNVAPRKKGAKPSAPSDFYPTRKKPFKLGPKAQQIQRQRKALMVEKRQATAPKSVRNRKNG